MALLMVAVGLVAIVCIRRVLLYIQIREQVQGVPTIHCGIETFEGFSAPSCPTFHSSILRPLSPFATPSRVSRADFTLTAEYALAKSNLIAVTQADSLYATYLVGSGSIANDIFANTAIYDKARGFRHKFLTTWGQNIATAYNGEMHRKHRNVVRACFSEEILSEVWDAATDCFDLMMEGCETANGGILVDVRKCMATYTMCIFGRAGFGEQWPWHTPTSDNEFTLVEALVRFEHSSAAQVMLPLCAMQLSPFKTMRKWGQAQVSLIRHFRDMVADRRAKLSTEHKDILTALVANLDAADDKDRLAEHEIFSNVFILILAGHETSANTLTFLVSFLALYPEVQEKMLREIESVNGSFNDSTHLRYCLACIYETLRLRDIVLFTSKQAHQDVTITYQTWDNDATGRPDPATVINRRHAVKAGSRVTIDSAGCSMNSFAYPDPHTFKPERWCGDPDLKQHFTAFALGTRGCIGKRFAEVEMLAFVTRLVMGFKVLPVRLPGETEVEMRQRYVAVKEQVTLGSARWDVRLERRD